MGAGVIDFIPSCVVLEIPLCRILRSLCVVLEIPLCRGRPGGSQFGDLFVSDFEIPLCRIGDPFVSWETRRISIWRSLCVVFLFSHIPDLCCAHYSIEQD